MGRVRTREILEVCSGQSPGQQRGRRKALPAQSSAVRWTSRAPGRDPGPAESPPCRHVLDG